MLPVVGSSIGEASECIFGNPLSRIYSSACLLATMALRRSMIIAATQPVDAVIR